MFDETRGYPDAKHGAGILTLLTSKYLGHQMVVTVGTSSKNMEPMALEKHLPETLSRAGLGDETFSHQTSWSPWPAQNQCSFIGG